MSNYNVLITSAGRRVELVQAFQKELKGVFASAVVYTADMQPVLSSACQVSDGSLVVPRVTDDGYIDKLLELCLQNRVGMVVPTIDTELQVLAENCSLFEENGISIIISSVDLIASCRDKRKTGNLFERVSLRSPKIYDRTAITFPCFAKPYDGSCSVGAQALNQSDQLTDELLSDEKMMFMELIDEHYTEFTVDAYYDRLGDLKCLVPRERIEVCGGEVSKGVTRKHDVYDYLLPICKKIDGARGCLTIQVFADIERASFFGLEINPRFGGGYPLAYSAGANYPGWLVTEYFQDQEVSFFDGWEPDLLMLRYDAKALVRNYG